jgi:hypothetical protein
MNEPDAYYYSQPGVDPIGPVTREQLRELADDGRISDDTLVIQEGGQEWLTWRVIRRRSVLKSATQVGGTRREVPKGTPALAGLGAFVLQLDANLDRLVTGAANSARHLWTASAIERVYKVANALTQLSIVVLVLVLLGSAFLSSDTASSFASGAVQWLLAGLIFVVYLATKQLYGGMLQRVRHAECALPNTPFLDVLGTLLIAVSLAISVACVWAAIRLDTGAFMLLGLAAFIYLGSLGGLLLHPELLGVQRRETVPGEELASLVSVFTKLNVLSVPVFMAILVGSGAWMAVAVVMQTQGEGANAPELSHLSPQSWLPPSTIRFLGVAAGGGLLALIACMLPFLAYLQFLVLHFFVDLSLAVLSLRRKEP